MSETLVSLAASFNRALRADGKAERTRILYGQSITFFSAWLVEQGKEPVLDEFTRLAVRDWMTDLGETKAPGTVAMRFRGLRRFSRWLVAEDIRNVDPMKGMAEPVVPETAPTVLADAQLGALLKACKGTTFEARRDEAMVRLFLDCGIRVAELCGIDLEHVDLDAEAIKVTGKGNKSRMVYPSVKTVRAIERYLRERAKHRNARLSPRLFLSQRGAMSTDGARYRMEVLGERAGIKGGLHPHLFRHAWASDFLLAGGQERDLKRLAGWSTDTMLEVYGRAAADNRAAAAARRLARGDRL